MSKKPSTDRKPTRNVTAADLKLETVAQISAAIDDVTKDVWALEAERAEAVSQRDELLDAAKDLVKWSWTMRHADREADVWKALDRAIARAERKTVGQQGRK